MVTITSHIEPWPELSSTWILARTLGNLSDNRILSLHRIFPIMLKENESITNIVGNHYQMMTELEPLKAGMPADSEDLVKWCLSLTTTNDKYSTMKDKCFDILLNAHQKGDSIWTFWRPTYSTTWHHALYVIGIRI
ncbi:unnamed protein product [Absidia cylindrospora]